MTKFFKISFLIFNKFFFVKKIKVFKDDKTGDKWRIKRRGMRKRFDKIYGDRIILYANENKKNNVVLSCIKRSHSNVNN